MTVVKLVRCWVQDAFSLAFCVWIQCVDRWCIGTITPRSWCYEPLSVWWGGVEEWAWMRLYYLWGIACFSSMDIAGCGRRNKQTFSVFLPPPFLQGWACSQRRFCDWCLSMLGVYLFVWQTNALLTSQCHMLSSECILYWHQCLFIQVEISKVTATKP